LEQASLAKVRLNLSLYFFEQVLKVHFRQQTPHQVANRMAPVLPVAATTGLIAP
jgi:hypothetical protein